MPDWLPFEDYARLQRMKEGNVEVLHFPAVDEATVKAHAKRLRALMSSWKPFHHWLIHARGHHLVVIKKERWRTFG
jgi:hypothetical protein